MYKFGWIVLVSVLGAVSVAGVQAEGPGPEPVQAQNPAQLAAFKRPDSIPFPANNPYTPTKAALGKMLFFEPRLSRDRNLSCASCHNPSFGWEVPFDRAIGAGGAPLGRHAPTTINLAWTSVFFWDGRAPSMEAQARGPIEADVEMDLPLDEAVRRLKQISGYQSAFSRAFPDEGITEQNLLRAIATYERTIISGQTRFDRWVDGDPGSMTEQEKRGFAVFTGKGRCAECHSGWNFTDDAFHDIGLATEDTGRMQVTGQEQDRFLFKTPGLREIAARAPYMHNGSVPTLEAVISHYIAGGIPRPSRSAKMQSVALDQEEVAALVAFLRSLSSPQESLALPQLPPH